MDRLTGMAVFAKVVETGSFTKAAEALNLTKSAVSKQVSKLEDRLGARLLNRTTRSLALTEVGRAFHGRAERILAEAEEAELAVSRLQDEPRGTLRVNGPYSFSLAHLGPVLPEFMARHPELGLDFNLNDRAVDLIDEGYDLAVRIIRLPDSSLIAKKIAPFRRVVCATPDYWKRHGKPKHPDELADHSMLMYSYLRTRDELEFLGPDGPFLVKVSGRFHANSGDILAQAALAGLGAYYAPTFIVGDALRDGRLEAVLHDFEITDRGIYAVYPHNRHLSAKVRAFVDFLSEKFGPEPAWDQGVIGPRATKQRQTRKS